MTGHVADDPLFELLARLPEQAPPGNAVERVRARAHALLARQRHAGIHTGSLSGGLSMAWCCCAASRIWLAQLPSPSR